MIRLTGLSLALLAFAGNALAGPIEFNRDIRPIFSEYCFACHGPDTAKRKANLRLDTAEGGKTVLVPGKPDESELFRRLIVSGKEHMPPASTNKTLAPAQVALIRTWIEQGANYQDHWSFITPKRPALPAVRRPQWVRTPIDRFVLARLEAENLTPAPEADRRTLIRRLSFDLLGLPPTPAEIEAFVQDTRPDAYEKLVERLLESKHHGERLALFWLDLVRYGDTGGYHSDNHRDIYLYRDWVIDAFNSNKRFDRFTMEQLAGDLLPDANRDTRIASGYNRLLMTTEEGGAQPKEYTAKYAADRVRNASAVWLGLTFGCAECHNHKYDPLTLKEFYQFAAFWADVSEVAVGRQPQTRMPTPEQLAQMQRIDEQLAELRQRLTTSTPQLQAAQQQWEQSARAELDKTQSVWVTAKPQKVASSGGATLQVQPDLSVLSTGTNPAKDTYTLTLTTDQTNLTGLRLTALRHPSLPGNGLSRGNGNFVLTGLRVALVDKDGKLQPIKLASAIADFSQPGYPVESLLQPRGPGWAIEGHIHKGVDRTAVFTFAKPLAGGPGTTLQVRLEHNSAFPQHNIGRVRLDLTSQAKPGLGDRAGLPEAVIAALKTEPDKRTAAQKETLASHYRSIAPELQAIRDQIARLTAQRQTLEKSAPETLITTAVTPRTMRVLPRGNWLDDSGEIVAPGTPASLPPLGVKGRANRLDLARWLVAPEHPLTARVFVNRLWRLFYGQGLVTSLEDFGSQGTWPSHPELLDWLAVEFRESGWDVRHLIRLLVTSSAYRMVATASDELRQRDPANRLLARQNRFRLDAELIRDNALAVSGLLSPKIGGPSVKPYQPAGYWAYLNFPPRDWIADKGENQYRRGLYTYVQRTFPHPSLLAFDAPSREECTAERARSNTPQQALVLLNDPTYVEAARVLAEKVVSAGKSEAERLTFAYRQVLGRTPRSAESAVLLPLLERHRQQYANDRAAAESLLSVGLAPIGKNVDRVELAAWTSLTRVLLNLHETITRE